ARLLWEQDVVGSNPAFPTKQICGFFLTLNTRQLYGRYLNSAFHGDSFPCDALGTHQFCHTWLDYPLDF
ncbi:MAG TPA: hypothetical protein PLC97_11990, partial [Myxococcota bacterium]|nr:hypothetical protein [Myxococcota bacterium]